MYGLTRISRGNPVDSVNDRLQSIVKLGTETLPAALSLWVVTRLGVS